MQVCVCVCVWFCVFARECFTDQMYLLFNSPSQQAALTKYMHALAHARLHNLRYKPTEWEMNMEMKTKQVYKYLVLGTGDGLLGAAKSMVNHRWLCSCSFVHVTAVQMFPCLTVQKMHANVCCYCVWELISNVFWELLNNSLCCFSLFSLYKIPVVI